MNCRDVELHGARTDGNLPRAHVPNPPECGLCIAYAKRECTQDRRFRRMDRVGEIGGLGVDDDVHRPLPIELDFPGSVPRDRTEPQLFEQAAERLRLGCGELDEFDAADAKGIEAFFGDRLVFQARWSL